MDGRLGHCANDWSSSMGAKMSAPWSSRGFVAVFGEHKFGVGRGGGDIVHVRVSGKGRVSRQIAAPARYSAATSNRGKRRYAQTKDVQARRRARAQKAPVRHLAGVCLRVRERGGSFASCFIVLTVRRGLRASGALCKMGDDGAADHSPCCPARARPRGSAGRRASLASPSQPRCDNLNYSRIPYCFHRLYCAIHLSCTPCPLGHAE